MADHLQIKRPDKLFGKLTAGLVGGILVAVFGVPFLGMLLSGTGISLAPYVLILILAVIALVMVLAALTASIPRSWRFVLILAGCSALALSAAHYLHLGSALVGASRDDFIGLMSFFFGVILLLIGLLIGREKPGA